MKQLLQDLCNLNAEKTNSLDYLLGQISVMLTRTDAYQNLRICVPDGTVQQMMSSEQSEAYQNYTTARKEFLEAILAQQDSPELTIRPPLSVPPYPPCWRSSTKWISPCDKFAI